ncbi:MAG TPA: hypothetical protein VGM84_06105 [Steroidobacteraceae bacterium]
MGGRRALFELICCASLAACRADPAAQPSDACRTQVIVVFASPVQTPPDPDFVKAVATASHVHLSYVRSINPELHVFVATSAEADRDCSRSLARLRGDARIRSVDIDQRRVHH